MPITLAFYLTLSIPPPSPLRSTRFLCPPQCPASDAESWVLKATASGLVDCRMDQLAQTVVVARCTERTFDLAAWKSLQSGLHAWRATIDNLLNEDSMLPK